MSVSNFFSIHFENKRKIFICSIFSPYEWVLTKNKKKSFFMKRFKFHEKIPKKHFHKILSQNNHLHLFFFTQDIFFIIYWTPKTFCLYITYTFCYFLNFLLIFLLRQNILYDFCNGLENFQQFLCRSFEILGTKQTIWHHFVVFVVV